MFLSPMMGKSSRFSKAGYSLPKFMLNVGDETLFEKTVISFKDYFDSDLFVFTIPKDMELHNWLLSKIKILKISNFRIVLLDEDTNGQADTVMQTLADFKKYDGEINIFNIDTILLRFEKLTQAGFDGYLEVFKGEGDHWSFAEIDEKNMVLSTSEKVRISPHCSNGFYNFRTKEIFIEGFEKQKIYNNENNLGEIYIAPIYNFLIESGHKITVKYVNKKDIIFSGTPEEYELVLKNKRNEN